MKKCIILLYLALIHSSLLFCQSPLPQLAKEIVSSDLAITSKDHFTQKITSLVKQAEALLSEPFSAQAKQQASRLYDHLDTLIEVYADRYKSPIDMLDEVKNALKELSQKFKLESQNPYIVPILENTLPMSIGTSSIDEFFDFVEKDKKRSLDENFSNIF